MRFTIIFLQVLLAVRLTAAPLDSRLLTLIPDDARFIVGIDLNLYRQSALADFYPFTVSHVIGNDRMGDVQRVRQVIIVNRGAENDGSPLWILSGVPPSAPASPGDHSDLAPSDLIRLDSNTAVFGDPQSAREAVRRWAVGQSAASDLAPKIKAMSESYDNWFLAVRPFESLEKAPQAVRASKYRGELNQMVQEIRGGILLGRTDELRAELTMKNPEDALAVAALARWLPGLIQQADSNSIESRLADLAENLVITSTGSTVSLSFTLEEAKLHELMKSRREQDKQNGSEGILQ